MDNIDIKNFEKNQDKDQDLDSMKYLDSMMQDLETDRKLTQLENQVLTFNWINLQLKIAVCGIIIFAFGGVLYCSWILIKNLIYITILGNPYSVFKDVFADHSDNKGHLKIAKDLMNKFR